VPTAKTLWAYMALRSRCSWSAWCTIQARMAVFAGVAVGTRSAVFARVAISAGMAWDTDTGGATRARNGLECADSFNLGKDFFFHHVDFGAQLMLLKRLALQECGLGHFKLLLGHGLLVAESYDGCAISSFRRFSPGELIAEPGISSLKVGNAVLVIGDGALVLLLLILKRRLKIVNNLHVLLDLATQRSSSVAMLPIARASRTTNDIDVDVLRAWRVAVTGILQPVHRRAQSTVSGTRSVISITPHEAAMERRD